MAEPCTVHCAMAGTPPNIHLIAGDRDQRMQRLVDSLTGKSDGVLNLESFDGQEAAVEDISAAAMSLPFMGAGAGRTVVVYNLAPPTKSAPFWRWLAQAHRNLPASTQLILTVSLDGLSGRERTGRTAAARALASETLSVHIVPSLAQDLGSGRNARRWIDDLARQNGITLDGQARELLLQRSELDGNVLAREVEKLAALVGYSARVTAEHVRAVDPLPAHVVVWDYIDAVVSCDPAKAVGLLAELLVEGEAAEAMIAMLAARVRQLITIRSLLAAGIDYPECARRSGSSPGMVRRAAPQAMAFSGDELANMLRAIVELDTQSKRGQIPHGGLPAGLEALTVRFCYRNFRRSARIAPSAGTSQPAKALA